MSTILTESQIDHLQPDENNNRWIRLSKLLIFTGIFFSIFFFIQIWVLGGLNLSFFNQNFDYILWSIGINVFISLSISYILLFLRHKYWIEFIWKILLIPFFPLWILLISRRHQTYRLYISLFFLFLILLSIPMYFTETRDEMRTLTQFCFGITTSILITFQLKGLPWWVAILFISTSSILMATQYGLISLLLMFAYAFFPRNIELKRYFSSGIPSIPKQQKQKSGFTLIELLIIVAVMGIVMVGISSSLSMMLNTTKTVTVKTEITHTLSSVMDYLMTIDSLPSPSGTSHPLPIPIERFTQNENLRGNYQVDDVNEPGLVKITVQLSESLPNAVTRRYTMICYRRNPSP